jgi:hypothetical protein
MTLPASMNALILKGHGFAPTREGAAIETLEPYLEYGSLPVPKPGPGQVLIRVRMASVNPSDIHFIKGEYGQPRIKGAAAGFEGVGDVVAGSGLYAAYLKGKAGGLCRRRQRIRRLGRVHRRAGRHVRCGQAGNARRGCGRPCGQSGDCLDHVRHRQGIRLEKLRLSPLPSRSSAS